MVVGEGRGSAMHSTLIAIVLALALVTMIPTTEAVDHIVGGAIDWTYAPTNDLTYYQKWADNSTFNVGDVLVFNYGAHSHDVAQYSTKAEYDRCSGVVVKTWTTGSDKIQLTSEGTFYYICSFANHCVQGMKLAVTTTSAVGSTPAPSSPASPPTALPPPPSGANPSSSLSMAGVVAAAFIVGCVVLV